MTDRKLKKQFFKNCKTKKLIPTAIALFKTPGLRDLDHSDPFMHNGSFDTIEDVIQFYLGVSNATRAGTLRNAGPELADIRLSENDIASLVKFLKALNEDYN